VVGSLGGSRHGETLTSAASPRRAHRGSRSSCRQSGEDWRQGSGTRLVSPRHRHTNTLVDEEDTGEQARFKKRLATSEYKTDSLKWTA